MDMDIASELHSNDDRPGIHKDESDDDFDPETLDLEKDEDDGHRVELQAETKPWYYPTQNNVT